MKQSTDSKKMVIKKRFWIRWLIRRLLTICLERKEWPKVLEGCRETLALIMRKAIVEPTLLRTLTEQYIALLEDLEEASNLLFDEEDEDTVLRDPIKLRTFGTNWMEHAFNLEEYENEIVEMIDRKTLIELRKEVLTSPLV